MPVAADPLRQQLSHVTEDVSSLHAAPASAGW